jgi:hypothetical protein
VQGPSSNPSTTKINFKKLKQNKINATVILILDQLRKEPGKLHWLTSRENPWLLQQMEVFISTSTVGQKTAG